MQKITVNKGNWSGEECEIVIQDDGTFTIGMEYTFRMEVKTLKDEWGEIGEAYLVSCLEETAWAWKGYGFEIRGEHWASFRDGDVERENKNPYIAFAQVAWNII